MKGPERLGKQRLLLSSVLIKEKSGKVYSDIFNIEPFIQGIINEKIKINVTLEGKYSSFAGMLKWDVSESLKYSEINNCLLVESDKEGEYEISCEIDGEIRTSNIIIYKDQNQLENSNFIKVPYNIYSVNKNEMIEIIPSVISRKYNEEDLYFDDVFKEEDVDEPYDDVEEEDGYGSYRSGFDDED